MSHPSYAVEVLCINLSIFVPPWMAAFHVRRDKAALSSGCKSHPAIRFRRKQPEQAWR
jgi:hypothetical protein